MDEAQQEQLIRALFGRPAQPDADVAARSREAALAAVGGSSGRRAARRWVPGQLVTAAAARARLTHGFPRPRLGWTRSWVAAVVSAASAVGAAGTAVLIWQLAAAPAAAAAPWSVAAGPGGMVTVTIRELRDPAGLQRRLREDGLPDAQVQFVGDRFFARQPPNRCEAPLMRRIFPQSTSASGRTSFTINPSAIPARDGLLIMVSSSPAPHGPGGTDLPLGYASGPCPSGGKTVPIVVAVAIGGGK